MANDPTFGVNNFGRPEVLTDAATLVKNLLTVLTGKPGSFPSLPQLGMDIQHYLYSMEEDLDTTTLKAELIHQCSDFFDPIDDGTFDIIRTKDQLDRPFLVFVIPYPQIDQTSVVVGVTIDKNQHMLYNFQITENQNL